MKIRGPATKLDRALAQVCMNCPACKAARQQQKGVLFWLVKKVEGRVCPFCQAYARVFGRQSHEPVRHPNPTSLT